MLRSGWFLFSCLTACACSAEKTDGGAGAVGAGGAGAPEGALSTSNASGAQGGSASMPPPGGAGTTSSDAGAGGVTSTGGGTGGVSAGDGAAVSTSAGGGAGASAGAGGAPAIPGSCDLGQTPTVARSFSPELFSNGEDPSGSAACTVVLNPERGIFRFENLRNLGSPGNLRSDGYTLIYGQVLIDDYRDSDIDEALLSTLASNFQALRDAGLKVLPRFYYAASDSEPDAPLDRVLSHIEQLTPLLQNNVDVIAALHAGFVGAWGEWHGSTNGLTEPAARLAIFDALLAALPATRMVLARRPSHKQEAYGGPLVEDTAYLGDSLSRVGHLNDCFLASENDTGTYQLAGEKDYAIADSAFTAVGGETCGVNPPRSECPSALDELALHHWSFINTSYHADVLASWQSGGCFDTVTCRLGYRFALLGHETPESVARGDTLALSLSLLNDGYARPFNARPLYVVLDGAERHAFSTQVELRQPAPGQAASWCLELELPSHITPGTYQLGLWLPDAEQSLQEDARYAIQLANGVLFDGGVNWLDATLLVTE